MNKKIKYYTDYLAYLFFVALLFVTAFQFSAWGISGTIYNKLRTTIFVIISALFILTFKSSNIILHLKTSLLRIHFWCLLIFIFIISSLWVLGIAIDFIPARDLVLALVVLLIGINMNLKEKQYIHLVNVFVLLYTLAAMSIVYKFAAGFVISEFYLPIPKNQIAPAFGVAFILSLYFGFNIKGRDKWIYFIYTTILLASLLVIRGRATIVAVSITTFIFILFYIPSRKYRLFTIAFILILIPYIGHYFYEAMFLRYDVSDTNSISAGRMTMYYKGINLLIKQPFGGLLENSGEVLVNLNFEKKPIHNYILFNLVKYGIIISLILLTVYFKYLFKIITATKQNTFQYFEVGPLVMIILMIISLFEYTYPYAPGSAIFFPFFLFGQYLKMSKDSASK